MNVLTFSILIGVLLQLSTTALGLRCYACSVVLDDKPNNNDPCIVAPMNVTGGGIVNCKPRMKHCTIQRNDFKDSGQVSSLERNCAENPPVLNDEIEGPTFITYFRACTEDLCNKGDGKQTSDGGNNGDGNLGGIIVQGVPDSAPAGASATLPLLLLPSLLYFRLA